MDDPLAAALGALQWIPASATSGALDAVADAVLAAIDPTRSAFGSTRTIGIAVDDGGRIRALDELAALAAQHSTRELIAEERTSFGLTPPE